MNDFGFLYYRDKDTGEYKLLGKANGLIIEGIKRNTATIITGPSKIIDTTEREVELKEFAQPEIIRCKDCMHRPIKKDGEIMPPGPEYDDEKCPCLCEDPFYSWMPRDDFFCANGERREE